MRNDWDRLEATYGASVAQTTFELAEAAREINRLKKDLNKAIQLSDDYVNASVGEEFVRKVAEGISRRLTYNSVK